MKKDHCLSHFYSASFLILILGSINSFASSDCQQGWTDLPPFYSFNPIQTQEEHFFLYGKSAKSKSGQRSPASVGKAYEGYPEHSNYKLIRKNTLVRPAQALKEESSPDDLILVDIVSESESSRYLLGLAGPEVFDKEKKLIQKTERGFISPKSLAPSTAKDILFVTKDSHILSAENGLGEMVLKYGEGLRPIVENNLYKVMNCDGKFTYMFQVISPDESRNLKEITVDDISCVNNQLMDDNAFKDMQKLVQHLQIRRPDAPKIEVNEWGLTRLQEDPTGAYNHFTGPDPIGTDDWGKPDTICSLMTIADEWKKTCSGPGCALQIGDIGFPTPAVLENGRDPLGHLQHADGSCIDMRPFRKDRKMEGVNLKYSIQDYDRVRTKKFIDFILKQGATPVYFNDSSIINSSAPNRKRKECDLKNPKNDEQNGVFSCEGHSDHIHFCLRKPFVKGC